MKRIVSLVVLIGILGTFGTLRANAQAQRVDPGTAVYLSALIPGLGESYNAGFKNGFPWFECLLGTFIPFYRFSSMVDASAGRTDRRVRFSFWSLPKE
jgi:hypothetical protein